MKQKILGNLMENTDRNKQEKPKLLQKNIYLAYTFWFFFGFIGVHRFYAKQRFAWLYIVLSLLAYLTLFFGLGFLIFLAEFVWWLIDGVRLYKLIKVHNTEAKTYKIYKN